MRVHHKYAISVSYYSFVKRINNENILFNVQFTEIDTNVISHEVSFTIMKIKWECEYFQVTLTQLGKFNNGRQFSVCMAQFVHGFFLYSIEIWVIMTLCMISKMKYIVIDKEHMVNGFSSIILIPEFGINFL